MINEKIILAIFITEKIDIGVINVKIKPSTLISLTNKAIVPYIIASKNTAIDIYGAQPTKTKNVEVIGNFFIIFSIHFIGFKKFIGIRKITNNIDNIKSTKYVSKVLTYAKTSDITQYTPPNHKLCFQ
jgi:hypothetical protein